MSHNDEFEPFLPRTSVDPDQLSMDIPAERSPLPMERIPSADDPMGRIELRGRAFQGLSGGRVPWWVLIAGWIMFGGLAVLSLKIAIYSSSIFAWIVVAIALLPLLILFQGTQAKLTRSQRRPR